MADISRSKDQRSQGTLRKFQNWAANTLPDLSTVLLIIVGLAGILIGFLDLFLDFDAIPGLKPPTTIILLLVALLATAIGIEKKISATREHATLLSRLTDVEGKITTVDAKVIGVEGKVDTSIKDLNIVLRQFENPHADTFFKRKTSEGHLIEQADQEVLIIQETGALLLEKNKEALRAMLNRGGRVRILLSLPRDATACLLSFRNDDQHIRDILHRSTTFESHLRGMKEGARKQLERLEVRYTPYPTEITAVIADPEHLVLSKRKAVIRYAGFRVPYDDKLDFALDGVISPRIFQHYAHECKRLYEHASKVVLLTGKPKSGKTTMLKDIVTGIQKEAILEGRGIRVEDHLYYIISESKWNGEERTGFEVITSMNQVPQQFATRMDNGEHKIDPNIWVPILKELTEAHKQGKVIILDEIGPLQLQVPGFREVVNTIMNDITSTLFAVVTLDDNEHAYLSTVKQHHRSTLLKLTPESKTELLGRLNNELYASFWVANILPLKVEEAATR